MCAFGILCTYIRMCIQWPFDSLGGGGRERRRRASHTRAGLCAFFRCAAIYTVVIGKSPMVDV